MKTTIEHIANICHEANRAVQVLLGETPSPPWSECSQQLKDSAISGVKFCLESLNSGQEPSGAVMHTKWMNAKLDAGWTYGPEKNEELKTHPCIQGYSLLPVEQKLKDYVFNGVCRGFWVAARHNDDLYIADTTSQSYSETDKEYKEAVKA